VVDSLLAERLDDERGLDEINLRELLGIFRDKWRWIASFWASAALLSLAYALTATPIYRTNALLHVEETSSGMVGIDELTSQLTGNTPATAEIEIIRSRAVLEHAISQASLQFEVRPAYLAIIGEPLARRHDPANGVAGAFLGLKGFAWGGESVQIDRLDVPRSLQGETLTLVARGDNEFTLSFADEPILEGQVGLPAQGRNVSIFVSELVARPGTRFHVIHYNRLDALNNLAYELSVIEKGKSTGILVLTLDGPSPRRIADTLNTIVSAYLRQNVARTAEAAAKTLAFLEKQLPKIKKQLDAAETALIEFRTRQGTINLTLGAQGLLSQIAEVEKQLSGLELKRVEMAQRYTAAHPVLIALTLQQEELLAIRSELQSRIRELPDSERDALGFMRDAEVSNGLYVLLLNRAQELKVIRAGTVGNVRIIDHAFVPAGPIKPKRLLLIVFGSVLGVLMGLLFAYLHEAINPAIRDPAELEETGGLPVYAIIPHSDNEERLDSGSGNTTTPGQLLVTAKPDDIAVEALRSLRTSLEFLLFDIHPQIVTIGGPAPGAGKSFVTANLATLFLQAGKKTLLIDADLRKGHLHKIFSESRTPGLTEVIMSRCTIDDAVRRVMTAGLDFIPTGEMPPNPAELLTSSQFERMLTELGERYDIVLMDAPPALGAPEAVSLAQRSAINLLVVRCGQQTPREVELTLNKLEQGGAGPRGFILNDLQLGSRRHAYAGYHYYHYRPQAVTLSRRKV